MINCLFLDNYTQEVLDDEFVDPIKYPERYTLVVCFDNDEQNDCITERWVTTEGTETIRYLVIDKYHTCVPKERNKKLKGEPLYLKLVILPYSFFLRWSE